MKKLKRRDGPVTFGVHWIANGWVVTGFDSVRREYWGWGLYRWRWTARLRARVELARLRGDTE